MGHLKWDWGHREGYVQKEVFLWGSEFYIVYMKTFNFLKKNIRYL